VPHYREGSQYNPGEYSTQTRSYEFELEAGRRYRLSSWSNGTDWGARIEEKKEDGAESDAEESAGPGR
jgi:hypothetical protein